MPWYPPWNWVSSSQRPLLQGGQIVRSGFICGFIELYPGGLEDLGGILAARTVISASAWLSTRNWAAWIPAPPWAWAAGFGTMASFPFSRNRK